MTGEIIRPDHTLVQHIEALGPYGEDNHEFALRHELLEYGVDAIAHVLLMEALKPVVLGTVPLTGVARKFGLRFSKPGWNSGFHAAIRKDARLTVYLPHASFQIFSADYLNRFSRWNLEITEEQYRRAHLLCSRSDWQLDDLTHLETVAQGEIFAHDLWRSAVNGFDQLAQELQQPADLTNLGAQLIDYYVSALPQLK